MYASLNGMLCYGYSLHVYYMTLVIEMIYYGFIFCIPYSGFLSRIKLVTKIKRNDINSRVCYLSRQLSPRA